MIFIIAVETLPETVSAWEFGWPMGPQAAKVQLGPKADVLYLKVPGW